MLEEFYKNKQIPSIGIPILNPYIVLHNRLTQTEALKNWTSFIPIGSGIINKNYKVVLNKKDSVAVKFLSKNSVGIKREEEIYNYKIANSLNIAPKLIHCDIDRDIVATQYIDGGTVTLDELSSDEMLFKILDIMKTLHSGKRFKNNFDIFESFEKYLSICQDKNYKLPKKFLKYKKRFDKLNEFITFNKLDLVPCHNDLWVHNILKDNDELKIIDFEFSGNNDPRFELGNFWQESNQDNSYIEKITTKYFGHKDMVNELVVEAYGIASAYTWCLVGVILSNESKIEFNYNNYIEDKFLFVKDRLTSDFIKKLKLYL